MNTEDMLERAAKAAGPLEDAAIVCERRDEFGHRHRKEAEAVRAVGGAAQRVLDDAITGDAPSGFALVPNEAMAELRAALSSAQGEPHAK